LARAKEFDITLGTQLEPLAKEAEARRYPLISVIIWRALLNPILEQGASKAYYHAAQYLSELRRLAGTIDDHRGLPTHAEYEARGGVVTGWHTGQDRVKRVSKHKALNFFRHFLALYAQCCQLLRQARQHDARSLGAQDNNHHNQALIALARRRCDVLFAMLRDGTFYRPPQPEISLTTT
jgi:hypothetical protein